MNNPLRLLLVDDSPYFLEAAGDFLRFHNSTDIVETATDGNEALAKSETLNPHIILLDLNLADHSGLDLIPAFRQHLPQTKIIMLTMMAQGAYRTAAMRAGADAYVQKSTMSDTLIPTIAGLMQLPETTYFSGRERAQALMESEIRYQAIFETSQDAILLTAPDGSILEANPAACEMFGRPADEIKRLGRTGLVDTSDPRLAAALEERARTGKVRAELTMIRADGSKFPADITSTVFTNETGQSFTSVILRDSSERNKAEKALRESEERFRQLVEVSPDMIAIQHAGQISYMNEVGLQMLGATRLDDVIGKTATEFLRPDSVAQTHDRIRRLEQGLANPAFEYKILRLDGQVINLELVSTPVVLLGADAVLVVGHDITQRKQAEEALRATETRFRALIENNNDAIAVFDSQGAVTFVSASLTRNFGHLPDEVVSKGMGEYLHPEDAASFEQHWLELLNAPGWVGQMEFRVRHKNGAWRWVEAAAQNLLLEPSVQGLVINFRDITERKQTEETLRHRLAELEALHTTSVALRTAQTREEALPILLDATLAALETEAGIIWLYDADSDELKTAVARGWFQQLSQTPIKPGEGVAGAVFASGQAHLSNEIRTDPDTRATVREQILAGWGGASLPIIAGAQPVGVLSISMPLPRQFTTEQVQLINSLTEMAGTTLHRLGLRAETQQRLDQLQALHNIDLAITGSMDLRMTLNVLLEHVTQQLNVDAACVRLFNPSLQTLQYAAGRGFHTNLARTTRIRLGEGVIGRAILEHRAIQANREQIQQNPQLTMFGTSEGFTAYYGLPLIAKGQIKGLLEVFHRTPMPIRLDWISFLETLAGQAAVAVDNAQLFEGLQRSNTELALAYDATIEGWSGALDLRDKETEGHSLRVTELTLRLARALGISDAELVHMRRGAILHDIGKMGIPDSILLKPDVLTAAEWETMKTHPTLAYELLLPIKYLKPALNIPYCHHERWDGTGYPQGLKGKQIPFAARIFAVADVWDALRSDRPYRSAWPGEKTHEHIRLLAGTHFDPAVVEVFLKIVAEV